MSNHRCRPGLALAALFVGLTSASPAAQAATGIAYIDGGNIRVSTVDGAKKAALTTDGSGSRAYESIAQGLSGKVFASVGNGENSLKSFVQFSPLGQKLSEVAAPYDNASGWTNFAYPLGFEVDASDTNLAYGFFVSRFPIGNPGNSKGGTWVSGVTLGAGSPPYENPNVNNPTFFGKRIVGVNNAGDGVVVQEPSNAPYQDFYRPWLATGGASGIVLKRAVIAPNGTTYAIEYENQGTGTSHIELHRHSGAAIPDGDDLIACDFPTGPSPGRVTFSPDSTLMAWRDTGGVKVAPVPDLTAPGPTCPSTATVISTTGTSPALGGIDVPKLLDEGGGDGGGDAKLTLKLKGDMRQRATALKVKATCSVACSLTVKGSGKADGERFATKVVKRKGQEDRATNVPLGLKAAVRRRVAGEPGRATITVTATVGKQKATKTLKVKLKT